MVRVGEKEKKLKVMSLSSYVRYDERENTNETLENEEYIYEVRTMKNRWANRTKE